MRIETIRIGAFGPHRSRVLRGLGRAAVIVVRGDNEAGKTSLLEFLTTMLFGFEATDASRHPYRPWSGGDIEGELEILDAEGRSHRLRRRLDPRPRASLESEGRLADLGNAAFPPVAGLGRRVFRTLFAIAAEGLSVADPESWRRIESSLLESGGDTGLRGVDEVVLELEAEARRLWRRDRRGGSRVRALEAEVQGLRQERDRECLALQEADRARRELAELDERAAALGEQRDAIRIEWERALARDQALLRLERLAVEKSRIAAALLSRREQARIPDLLERILAAAREWPDLRRAAQRLERLEEQASELEVEVESERRGLAAACEGLALPVDPRADPQAVAAIPVEEAARRLIAIEGRERRRALLGVPIVAMGAAIGFFFELHTLAVAGVSVLAFGLLSAVLVRRNRVDEETLDDQLGPLGGRRVAAGIPAAAAMAAITRAVDRAADLASAMEDLDRTEEALAEAAEKLRSFCSRVGLPRRPTSADLERLLIVATARAQKARDARREVARLEKVDADLDERGRPDRRIVADGDGVAPAEVLAMRLRAIEAGWHETREKRAACEARFESVRRTRGPVEIDAAIGFAAAEIEKARVEHDRLALLAALVREAGRRLRERRRPELLSRASSHLQALTKGRHVRLAERLDESGRHRLWLESEAGETRPVDRPFSRGLLEQVQLAWRLAWIETTPGLPTLPLILDEPFAHWDDERGRAAIDCLATFARGRQVIVMTCRGELADRLRRLPGAGLVSLEGEAGHAARG